jgi:hypothetical protein
MDQDPTPDLTPFFRDLKDAKKLCFPIFFLIFSLKKFNVLLKFCVKYHILQALFQKREGSAFRLTRLSTPLLKLKYFFLKIFSVERKCLQERNVREPTPQRESQISYKIKLYFTVQQLNINFHSDYWFEEPQLRFTAFFFLSLVERRKPAQ